MIAIIDYGLGNIGSILNMLSVIGERVEIITNPKQLAQAEKFILPGVGAFDAGITRLNESGLSDAIKEQCLIKEKPILGICLGMQLLGRRSEEGKLAGLELIPFDNIRFRFDANCNLKVPHMGWDVVNINNVSKLSANLDGRQRYYFVHSFHAKCDFDDNVLMTCEYGYEFAAAIKKDNIYGVQFHPEKSHDFGMKILRNFAKEC